MPCQNIEIAFHYGRSAGSYAGSPEKSYLQFKMVGRVGSTTVRIPGVLLTQFLRVGAQLQFCCVIKEIIEMRM